VPGPPMLDADSSAALAELVAKGSGGTLFLETDDCQASYDELSARGVTFNDPPTVQPYGIDTSFRDPSGNNIRLTQVLEFDPARGTTP
jgi:predicted enzyme related to lactoylglutathione lyase